jgi:hypothetical protein
MVTALGSHLEAPPLALPVDLGDPGAEASLDTAALCLFS